MASSSGIRLCFYGCGLIAEHHVVAVLRCREAGIAVRVVACEHSMHPFMIRNDHQCTLLTCLWTVCTAVLPHLVHPFTCGRLRTERRWGLKRCWYACLWRSWLRPGLQQTVCLNSFDSGSELRVASCDIVNFQWSSTISTAWTHTHAATASSACQAPLSQDLILLSFIH